VADLRSMRFWSAALLGALLVVAVVLSDGTRSTRPSSPARSLAVAADPAHSTTAVSAQADAPADLPTPYTARLAELGRMAESFRNESFLVANRDAGFICYRLADARPSDLTDPRVRLITSDHSLS